MLRNLMLIHPLASKSRARVPTHSWCRPKLGPETTAGPCTLTVCVSTLCLPGIDRSPSSQCLPSFMSQLLCLLSKRYLEINIWAPVLLIATEMSLLPGSLRGQI